jgi:hypothetical protein
MHLLSGEHMRRITKAALGGIAGCALILGATQAATGEAPVTTYTYAGDLVDLQLTEDGPFDDAQATLRVILTPAGSTWKLRVRGIDETAIAQEYGAHLHVGECVEGDEDGGLALAHYNTEVAAGKPKVVSTKTEVWFELVPDEQGLAEYQAAVPFVPVDPDGVMSIVIHEEPTNDTTGGAGDREACLPLDVSAWAPTTL